MDNNEITVIRSYKNRVASKIANVAVLILGLGITIALIGGFAVNNIMYDVWSGIKFAITMGIVSFISYILLEGLAEIIQLLQDIRDK